MGTFIDWLLGKDLSMRDETIGGEDAPVGAGPAMIAPPARSAFYGRDPIGLSMVYRAIVIHAVSARQLPIQEWRQDLVNAWASDERLVASRLIRQPDPNTSRGKFVSRTVAALAGSGNAYWWKNWDAKNTSVIACQTINPRDVYPYREKGIKKFRVAGREQVYYERDIQHLKLLEVEGSEYGLGPIQAARVEIEGALDVRDYSANWFQDSSVPTGVLKSDNIMTPEQADQAKARMMETQGGKRGVVVLGNGLSYMPIYLSPKDAQFIENMQYTTTAVARLFGVPSSQMLANIEGSSQTYQNVEQDWLGFVRFSNSQYTMEIEDALTQILGGVRYAKVDYDGFLRSDTTTRYSNYKTAIDAGFMLPSEVRKEENMPVKSGIDKPKPAPVIAAPVEKAPADDNA